ncbi:MAG: LysE family translocator [Pseudomonadota bacterium]
MPSAELVIPFLIASALFAWVPGPGMIYAVAQTLARGRRAGRWSAIGFNIAGLVHITAAAFGVAALMAVMPNLLTAMSLLGSGYLIWMGWRALRLPKTSAPTVLAERSSRVALRDSLIAELMNPKSVLFFFAFLPQFTDPAAALPIWAQILVLGMIVNLMFSVVDLVLIELSHGLLLSTLGSYHQIHRIGGLALVAMGAGLLVKEIAS